MTAIDNIINQIEGETQNRGNTKTRIAAVLRLLRNKIANLFSDKLDKGTYTGTADDLRTSIDRKEDKEAGKGLSTNDFTNAYKEQLDNLADYDIDLDEATTELKFKKGNNVVKRISLLFLDDEGTKLLYNRTAKTLELRDKRDNLLTSIPVSHFVSNIPTSIVVQNGKIKLMAGSEVINENTISYNDLANKPNLDFAPRSHSHSWNEITGKPSLNFAPLHHRHNWSDIDGKPSMDFAPRSHRHNWSDIDGKPSLNFAPLGHSHSWNEITGKPSMDFIPTSWNRRNNKEVIRTQVDDWLRINDQDTHTQGVYFKNSIIRTLNKFEVDIDGAEAVLSNLGLTLKKRLRINAWAGGDGADIKSKGKMQIGSSSGIVEFRKILDDLVNWNGNATVTIDINDGIITLKGLKNSVPRDQSAEKVWTTNGDFLTLPYFIGLSGRISGLWNMSESWYGRTLNVMDVSTVNLTSMTQHQNVTFRKCFAGGAVTFNTTGKQVVYTGDNTFNGGDGSTAVVSTADGNKMYIDIRNV